MPLKTPLKKIQSIDVAALKIKVKENIQKVTKHPRFPFFLKIGIALAALLFALSFGAGYFLQDKAEEAFVESLKGYDIGYTDFQISPFLRRAYVTDFRIKGFAGNRQNYVFAKDLTLKNLGTSKGKVSRFNAEAQNLQVYVTGWVGHDRERPAQLRKLSFRFKDNSHKKEISDLSLINKRGETLFEIDAAGLKDIEKDKRGDIISARFYFNGDLEEESIDLFQALRAAEEKGEGKSVLSEDNLRFESSAVYAYDPVSGIYQLSNLTGSVPTIDLTFGLDSLSWAKDTVNKPPYFLKQKLLGFKGELPIETLATLLVESKKTKIPKEEWITFLTDVQGNKVNADYASDYTYDEEKEAVDFTFYFDIKDQFKLSFGLQMADINFGLMKANKMQFLQISKLAGAEVSLVNKGYFTRSAAYKEKKDNVSSETRIEKELGMFDLLIARTPKVKFLKRAKSAFKDFMTHKNAIVFKLAPRRPVSVSEVVEMMMMAPDQALKSLDATIKGS
ncbi:MAG: hypothetical protein ACTSXQ_02390 [Alphaproteobacteria bacterium]